MRKKELRVRNDHLRWELTQAKALAGHQVKQINEHRMELAILKVERELQAVNADEVVAPEVLPDAEQPCPTCGRVGASDKPAEPATKVCPECAEEVRRSARKCRYCDYRFDGSKPTATNGGSSVARLGSATGA
jgi:hypothetical protein